MINNYEEKDIKQEEVSAEKEDKTNESVEPTTSEKTIEANTFQSLNNNSRPELDQTEFREKLRQDIEKDEIDVEIDSEEELSRDISLDDRDVSMDELKN